MISVDRHTVIQVLGGLMQKPELLSEVDKYFLELSDFPTQLDKFVFSAIYNLFINGAEKIHAVDIDNYLQSNSLAKQLMEKKNGKVFLQDCESQSELSNFNYYYNKLKKINLVKDLQLSKNDIDNIYCEDILNDNYTQINEAFEKMTTEDIVNKLKGKIASYENKYVLNNQAEESRPADTIRQRIKEWQQKPEVGCMLQGKIFNTITRGGRKGKLYIRSAGSGTGKAIPDYTIVPTPNGMRKVKEIKIGDYLFDRYGKPTKVLGVYPQPEKKRVYKVYFKSGRIAECCDEHLWSYYKTSHGKELYTKTLKEIWEESKKNGFKRFNNYCYQIPIVAAIDISEKETSVPPYTMGLMLGDENFHYLDLNKIFILSSEELSSEYPKSWGGNGHFKFIPEEYIFNSKGVRMELLRGLLDAGGDIDISNGKISYTTTNEKIKTDFITLVSSLGFLFYLYIEKKKNEQVFYHIDLIVDNEIKPSLFKLKRKKELAKQYLISHPKTKNEDEKVDPIVRIEETDDFTEMTCFFVDNEEHLFVAGETLWVTHNTRNMVGDACHIAYPIRYDSVLKKWVSTGSCEKVLYVMTEQETEEIDTMILAYLTGYNEDVFTYGTFDINDERIQKAIEIMEQYSENMNYAKISDPCSSVVKNLFRRKNLQDGIENFFYDYIFSSPAMLEEYRDLKIPEYVCLRMFTTTLKNLAVELNAFILTSTQISNDDDPKGGFKDFRNIQGLILALIYLFPFC